MLNTKSLFLQCTKQRKKIWLKLRSQRGVQGLSRQLLTVRERWSGREGERRFVFRGAGRFLQATARPFAFCLLSLLCGRNHTHVNTQRPDSAAAARRCAPQKQIRSKQLSGADKKMSYETDADQGKKAIYLAAADGENKLPHSAGRRQIESAAMKVNFAYGTRRTIIIIIHNSEWRETQFALSVQLNIHARGNFTTCVHTHPAAYFQWQNAPFRKEKAICIRAHTFYAVNCRKKPRLTWNTFGRLSQKRLSGQKSTPCTSKVRFALFALLQNTCFYSSYSETHSDQKFVRNKNRFSMIEKIDTFTIVIKINAHCADIKNHMLLASNKSFLACLQFAVGTKERSCNIYRSAQKQ